MQYSAQNKHSKQHAKRLRRRQFRCFAKNLRDSVPDAKQTLDGETMHLTPALSPFCSADSAKRGEGETLPASMKTSADGFYRATKLSAPQAFGILFALMVMRTVLHFGKN